MGRIYSVPFVAATVTAAGGDTDLFEITPADDKPVKIRGFLVSQLSEVGDVAEEGLELAIIRVPATFTSGNGTGVTPRPPDSADAAAGCTVETNGTTVATTSGTLETLLVLAWNNRNSPYEFWYPDPQFAPKVKQGEGMVLRMKTTLADDMTFAGTLWIEEE